MCNRKGRRSENTVFHNYLTLLPSTLKWSKQQLKCHCQSKIKTLALPRIAGLNLCKSCKVWTQPSINLNHRIRTVPVVLEPTRSWIRQCKISLSSTQSGRPVQVARSEAQVRPSWSSRKSRRWIRWVAISTAFWLAWLRRLMQLLVQILKLIKQGIKIKLTLNRSRKNLEQLKSND